MKRFADVNHDAVLLEKYSKKTEYNDNSNYKTFRDFLRHKQYNDENNVDKLPERLSEFYPSIRTLDGNFMKSSSISAIRYSLRRVFKRIFDIDIMKDERFVKSNEVYSAVLKTLKREGNGSVEHTPIISDEDIQLIQNMPTNTPVTLQYKVWLCFMIHFINRGLENLHSMKKMDIIINTNNNSKTLELRDFLTKNHQGMKNFRPSSGAVMHETKTNDCPIKIIEFYLSKLSSENDFFWQRPLDSFYEDQANWYSNRKIGINTISQFMKRISSQLKLSNQYTNHSLRASAITILGRNSFQDTEIACFSGHSSISALGIYKETSNSIKKDMSNCLHNLLNGSKAKPGEMASEERIDIDDVNLPPVLTRETYEDNNAVSNVINMNEPASMMTQDDKYLTNIINQIQNASSSSTINYKTTINYHININKP